MQTKNRIILLFEEQLLLFFHLLSQFILFTEVVAW